MSRQAFRGLRRDALVSALLAAAAPPLSGQGYAVWTSPGPFLGGGFGANLASVGDLDGDGVGDLAILRPPSAHAVSGATGSILSSFLISNTTGPSSLRDIAGIGDVDGDGIPDIAVGVAGTGLFNDGSVSLYSGATGTSLWSAFGALFQTLGRAVAGPGDLNGDGIPDVVATGVNVLRAFSGTNGAVLYSVPGAPGGSGPFDRSLAVAPDRDGDGVAELLAGGPGQPFLSGPAPAALHSGATGTVLQSYFPPAGAPGFDFGLSVVSTGDLDGDGISDVAVGTPQQGQILPAIPGGTGLVHVFSGASGAVLFVSAGGATDDLYGFSL
ncbi:MAG TPA: VCBS repeat-containing protein, partial [Planctomycetota bacterium]|nr:VCBS repeat-containing protein [Planctomycetota bacterium]